MKKIVIASIIALAATSINAKESNLKYQFWCPEPALTVKYPGKPGESNMANAAAGLGPARS